MEFKTFVFYFLAVIMVVAALRVITARNPVHAALFLVLTFFNAGGLWLLLQAEFLAVTLVMVYVGAVMVLFLFVVMMLDIDEEQLHKGYVRHLPVGLLVAAVMLFEILTLIGIKAFVATPFAAEVAVDGVEVSNTVWIARRLFTDFLLPFEVAAVILTVAVIAAVTLTLRRREGTKHQNPAQQARTRAGDRLRMVKMSTSVHVADDTPAPDAGTVGEEK